MKFGEFKIIKRTGKWAIVAKIDETHPDLPFLLTEDYARYFYCQFAVDNLPEGSVIKEQVIQWLISVDKSEHRPIHKQHLFWLRNAARMKGLINLSEQETADGQKGKGAR